jgi:phosphoglycerate kinase
MLCSTKRKNSTNLADKLASLADIYVNDDFGTAHKAHASNEGVVKFFKKKVKPAVAGITMKQVIKCDPYSSVKYVPPTQIIFRSC